MDPDRKTLIADAAIALLAKAGAKGLTHRAVDVEAGLPQGSSSAYCSTRLQLLTLALLRHAALDQADLQADALQWAQGQPSVERFIDLLARRVIDWLSPAKQARLVARFELFLIASREPDLAAIVGELRGGFLQASVEGLRRVGVAHPEAVAPGLLMTVDGLLMSQVADTRHPIGIEPCKALLRRVIQSASASDLA